ncbi:MAG: porin [Candidatus Moduliflexus flocculans]|nr:porin [Candidatus Moduliflexus flocculans]
MKAGRGSGPGPRPTSRTIVSCTPAGSTPTAGTCTASSFAAAAGPVLLQGEYTATSVNQFEGLPKANFSGYYAFASWMITGEKRPYSVEEGEPAGYIYPKNRSLGAFELAVRISNLSLNDMAADVMGGEGNNVTLALNWRPYSNLRFMVNYIFVNHDEWATGHGDYAGNDDYRILQTGFYFSF